MCFKKCKRKMDDQMSVSVWKRSKQFNINHGHINLIMILFNIFVWMLKNNLRIMISGNYYKFCQYTISSFNSYLITLQSLNSDQISFAFIKNNFIILIGYGSKCRELTCTLLYWFGLLVNDKGIAGWGRFNPFH